MKLINIGFGNMVCAARLLAIVSPESAPIKRIIQESRERSMLIDATYGRRTRAVLIMDTDHVILSAILPETIASRAQERAAEEAGQWLSGQLIVISGPSGVGKSTLIPQPDGKAAAAAVFLRLRDDTQDAPRRDRPCQLSLHHPGGI